MARGPIEKMLLDSGAVRFGDFTLASGQRSDVYVDIKRAWTNPSCLRLLAQEFALRVVKGDILAGLELGAVPLVVATALETGLNYVIVRKQVKPHGTRAPFEGEIPQGSHVVVLEDVTTTGNSVLDTVDVLRTAGGRVDRAIVAVDREAGAGARLLEAGVRLEFLTTLSRLREGSP